MASPFPQTDTLTRSEYEALRGPATNGNGDTPEPSGPAPRTCEGCGGLLTEKQLRAGGKFCSVRCSARANGTAAAAKAKANHAQAAIPTPMVRPLANPVAAPNPAMVLAAWGAMLGGLDQAGIRLDGYSVSVTPDSWSLQLHPSRPDRKESPMTTQAEEVATELVAGRPRRELVENFRNRQARARV